MFCLIALIFCPLLLISNTLKSLNCFELQKLSGIFFKKYQFLFLTPKLTSVLGMLYLPSSKWPTLFVSEVFAFLGAVTSTLFPPHSPGWFAYCVNQPAQSLGGCCVLSTVLGAEHTRR